MFCIKFNGKSKAKLKEKFSVIFELLSLLPTEKKLEIYWSDYTFAKVSESKSFDFIQDTILSNSAIIDNKNSEKFISIIINLTNKKKLRIEITPPKARTHHDYMPHIEFSFDNDDNLYDYFKNNKKLSRLVHIIDKYKSDIDEAYFYDPLGDLDCYSDVSNRLWQKRNSKFTFAHDLLGSIKDKEELEIDTMRNLAYNFTDILFNKGIDQITSLIQKNSLEAKAVSGSLILSGDDIPELIDILQVKLKAYMDSFLRKNPYEKEFFNVFK